MNLPPIKPLINEDTLPRLRLQEERNKMNFEEQIEILKIVNEFDCFDSITFNLTDCVIVVEFTYLKSNKKKYLKIDVQKFKIQGLFTFVSCTSLRDCFVYIQETMNKY